MTEPWVPGAPPRAAWSRLTSEAFDLLVVGGGIHGAGVARDAALRGLRVALVERADWASGTSSRSTKMLHGGLRYLKQGRIGQVRRALAERELHCRIAPGWTHRITLVVPPPVRGTRLWLRAGIALYGLLAGRAGGARFWRGDPRYEDVLIDDANFVLALVEDARTHGACALNHVAWTGSPAPDRHAVVDRVSGATGVVRAGTTVLALGPWAGQAPAGSSGLRLTRGTHVVLAGTPGDDAGRLFLAPEDRRPLFLLPYGPGHSLLGTTDLDVASADADPVPTGDELRYLRESVCAQFPVARTWSAVGWQCGLRPLVDAAGGPGSVSREERIKFDPGARRVEILGGKYTGYRRVAERAVDQVCGLLGNPASGRTGRMRIPDPPVPGGPEDRIRRAIQESDAVRLEDVFARRTRLADWGLDDAATVRGAAELLAAHNGAGERAETLARAYLEQREARLRVLRGWES